MIKCKCLTRNNKYIIEYAYTLEEFPFSKLKAEQKGKSKYIELPGTYDIETSTIHKNDDTYEGFMYHWQACIEGYVVFGRTWKEFQEFINKLIDSYLLSKSKKLVIYVHNLSYEFQFLWRFFNVSNVFATDSRKVLKAVINDCIELRCSYRLSNMNLQKFIENTPGTIHMKGVGDLDYKIVRTPSTKLTEKGYGYNFNDVMGLYEALLFRLQTDTLDTIPLTSTGYIRRKCRNAMRVNKANHIKFEKGKFDLDFYNLLKECFRGGNTASNRYYCMQIMDNVDSFDKSSSYPFQMISKQYPTGQFMYGSIETIDELEEYNKKYCTVARYYFVNLRIKNDVTNPYIPFEKCRQLKNEMNYNGRIMYADSLEISLCNIDYEIIKKQYDYDELYIDNFYFARKDYLPKELRKTIYELFEIKSKLKGIEDKEYEYMKHKGELNSTYGMMVTDILHDEFIFNTETGEYKKNQLKDKEEELKKYFASRNNFLCYYWGVFVTAYARKELQDGIDIVEEDNVYNDTDSVKCIGDHTKDFEHLNKLLNDECNKNGIKNYVDIDGKRFYMGTWDKEEPYKRFITLGSKKYAYEYEKIKIKETSSYKYTVRENKIGVTVSGLNKKKGAEELKKKGGLEQFKIGTVFYNAGRSTAYYNNDDIHIIKVNEEEIETGSNIAIKEDTYTLGITDTMLEVLENL